MSDGLREMVEQMQWGQYRDTRNQYYGNQGSTYYSPGSSNYQPPTGSPFMINSSMYSGDEQASRTAAAIARAQYEDYKRRFIPIRNMLVSEVTTNYDDMLDQEMGRTRSAVTSGFDRAEGSQRRRLERYGVNSPGTNFNQAETSSMVGGLNLTRQRSKERKMNLAFGGMNATRGVS